MTRDATNPLLDWLSFPEAVLLSQQEVSPTDAHGWGLNLVLALPMSIAYANVRTQLVMAGFTDESASSGAELFRFIREDAYVWGSISAAPEGHSSVLLSCTRASEPD